MIIGSLLDTDLYKFTMMQVVLHQYPAARWNTGSGAVRPASTSRPWLAGIRDELEHLCSLRFGDDELAYLRSFASSTAISSTSSGCSSSTPSTSKYRPRQSTPARSTS